jgi:HD-like signal output (HDOD) protein
MSPPTVRELLDSVQDLPTLPVVLGKVLDAVWEPETSAVDLAEHIAADQSLAARLLRLVNSAYYSFRREVTTVPDAVVLLGFIEVRNLVLTATAYQHLNQAGTGFDAVQHWRHSLASALAAETCAKATNQDPARGHYIAGLLHDMGKIALDLVYPEQYGEVVQGAEKAGIPLHVAEAEAFSVDHAAMGGELADYWNLPKAVSGAIRNHHTPEACTTKEPLTCTVVMADYLTAAIGFGETKDATPLPFPEHAAKPLGLNAQKAEALVRSLEEESSRIEAMIGVLTQ